eukprot:CAMPEP_0194367710 /NCGR_PEP_ID=MMETSP0174-20130528/15852_1 /TAXON_ID=216777 /ORGANISM="Proboscia alata, Strain PI-D3" /LENGTH=597 /DNA_ID=CAMNT_0039143657 /DNA_START=44 /DNA_END=1837 /DNA_ORIENTATION=-
MADCGVSGSALDRVITSVRAAGNATSTNDFSVGTATNALSSLIQTATTSSGGGSAMMLQEPSMMTMPQAPPSSLILMQHNVNVNASKQNTALPQSAANRADPVAGMDRLRISPATQQQYPSQLFSHQPYNQEFQHHQQNNNYNHPQMQQQQHIQQQQHGMMMQQQSMMMMSQLRAQSQFREQQTKFQQQQQQNTTQNSVTYDLDEATDQNHIVDTKVQQEEPKSWIGDLDEDADFQNYMQNDFVDNGNGVERLAKAWSDASNELNDLYDDDNTNASNYNPADFLTEQQNAEVYEVSQASRDMIQQRDTNSARSQSSQIQPPDFMERGMSHFQSGNLAQAIPCFEAETLASDSSTAWQMLGKCHAENDEDRRAISCLQRSIVSDPYSLDTLLALTVSHVNESDNRNALHCLQEWIANNPKYAGMDVSTSTAAAGTAPEAFLEQVQNLLLSALSVDANDANVHEALGVCYNVCREYDAAVHSLESALALTPDSYTLWNKLGATLANGNRRSDALPAYLRALELRPKYARTWLNMAISHGNMNNYNEAARAYLQTLALNPNAVHCWGYLRVSLTCAERWDLLPLANERQLEAFRDYFDFV